MKKFFPLLTFLLMAFSFPAEATSSQLTSCKTDKRAASYSLAIQHHDLKMAECLNKLGSSFINTESNREDLEYSIQSSSKRMLEILIKNGGKLNWIGYKAWSAINFRLSEHLIEYSDLSRPLSQIPLDGQEMPKERLVDLRKVTPESEKVFIHLFESADDLSIKQLSKNSFGEATDQSGSLLYSLASLLCEVSASKIMNTDKLLAALIKRAKGHVYFGPLDIFSSFTNLQTADGVTEDLSCHKKISQAFIRKKDWRLISTKEGFEELGRKIIGKEKYEKLKKERTKKQAQ